MIMFVYTHAREEQKRKLPLFFFFSFNAAHSFVFAKKKKKKDFIPFLITGLLQPYACKIVPEIAANIKSMNYGYQANLE